MKILLALLISASIVGALACTSNGEPTRDLQATIEAVVRTAQPILFQQDPGPSRELEEAVLELCLEGIPDPDPSDVPPP